jgi:hypothetical protein
MNIAASSEVLKSSVAVTFLPVRGENAKSRRQGLGTGL